MEYLFFISLFLFFVGLFFGSFFLVVIDRFSSGSSFLIGRSTCEFCKHVLSPLDLIPVLSFVYLQGRCRYCHKKLSLIYPLFEILTGLLFASIPFLLLFQATVPITQVSGFITLLYTLYVVSVFLVITGIDIKIGIIPFVIVLPAFAIALLYRIFMAPETVWIALLSAFISFGSFLMLHIVTKGRGMGFGDVVLAGYLGLLLSFPSIVPSLYIAFLTGAVVSLILILTGRKKMKGSTIPFGPFLVFGAFIGYFWGEAFYTLFFRLFLT